MFIAMAQDWRVLLIKLAIAFTTCARSRLCRWPVSARSPKRPSTSTPLAHRLGVQQVKWNSRTSVRDPAPEALREIEQMVAARQPERRTTSVKSWRRSRPSSTSSHQGEVRGRPKHLWSIYEKMVIGGKEFDDIFDLVGLRVIVDEDRDCWP